MQGARRRKRLWSGMHRPDADEDWGVDQVGHGHPREKSFIGGESSACASSSTPISEQRAGEPTERAAKYPYIATCGFQVPPDGWEVVLYFMLFIEGEGDLGNEEGTMPRLVFPEKALGLTGGRAATARGRAAERLGLSIQTLRHLAANHAAELRTHAHLVRPWELLEVRMSPISLHHFLSSVASRDTRFCAGRSKRWDIARPRVETLLENPAACRFLLSVKAIVEKALVAIPITSGETHWWELWSSSERLVSGGFISDEAAAAGFVGENFVMANVRALSSSPAMAVDAGEEAELDASTLRDKLVAAESRAEAAESLLREREAAHAQQLRLLQAAIREVEADSSADWEAAARSDTLTAAGLKAAAEALMEALGTAVQNPRDDSDRLFAGGLMGLVSIEQSRTVQRAEVLDKALMRLPVLKAELERQMATRRGVEAAKVRTAYLYVVELARTRTQKVPSACVLPWALAVYQIALNVPPMAMEGLRLVLGHTISYRRTWQFLRDLTAVVVRSYPTWWPGVGVGFADDNFQKERHRTRQRLGQYNNHDTNELQQADFSIAFPLLQWWVERSLRELGLHRKPFPQLRLSDFWVGTGAQQPWLGQLCNEWQLSGRKGSVLVERQLQRVVWARRRGIFPAASFLARDWESVYTTTAEGESLQNRQPTSWVAQDARVLKLTLNNTQKPDQVGQGEECLMRWFGIGGDAPCRRFTVVFHDWLLFRNSLTAKVMTPAELQQLRQVRRAKQCREGRAGGAEEEDGEGEAEDPLLTDGDVVVAEHQGADERLEKSADALERWLKEERPTIARKYAIARKWFGSGSVRHHREAAGLTGPSDRMTLSLLSQADLTRLLRYAVGSTGAVQAEADTANVRPDNQADAGAQADPAVCAPILRGKANPPMQSGATERWLSEPPKPKLPDLRALLRLWHGSMKSFEHLRGIGLKGSKLVLSTLLKNDAELLIRHFAAAGDQQINIPDPGNANNAPGGMGAVVRCVVDTNAPEIPIAQPTAPVPPLRPKATDAKLAGYMRAIELQSCVSVTWNPIPSWDPLDNEARQALSLTEHGMESLLSRYEEELSIARAEFGDLQCQRFGRRWLAEAAHRLTICLAYCSGLAVLHYQRLLSRFKDRATCVHELSCRRLQAKMDSIEETLADMRARACELHSRRTHILRLMDTVGDELSRARSAGTTTSAGTTSVDESLGDPPNDPSSPARAFPQLKMMHSGPGLMHLLQFGLLGAIFKIYFAPLLHFAGHTVLGRKHVTAKVNNYFACDALYYRVADAILTLMAEAHQAHSIYTEQKEKGFIVDAEAYRNNFLEWYRAGLQSEDAPFIFYSGFALGVGLLYRIAKQAISNRDNMMCYALLLPAMGVFRMTAKHNLCLQCFLSLTKLMCSTEEVARTLLANITQSFSGRKAHAIAADALLEMLQGFVKGQTGKVWDPTAAKVHCALNFYLNKVREQISGLPRGAAGDGEKKQGQRVGV